MSKAKTYVKHLVECNCVLPQFKNRKDIIFHKFVVFSKIGFDDKVITSYVKCNNCNGVHRVYEISKSELMKNENSKSVETIDEIKLFLPEKLQILLEKYDCDLPTWQETQFIIDSEAWGSRVILSREVEQSKTTTKINLTTLLIAGKTLYKLDKFEREDSNGEQ
jgi:hypothetical protein